MKGELMEELEMLLEKLRNWAKSMLAQANSSGGKMKDMEDEVANLKNKIASLEIQLADAESAPTSDMVPVMARLKAIESAIEGMPSGGGGSDSGQWSKLWSNFAAINSSIAGIKQWMRSLPMGDKGAL